MSDEKPNPSEKPSGKTSSVPLKKETVRITLRKDAEGSAPPPPAPGAPPAPKPPAAPALGAKTVPLTPAPPVAAGAPLAQPTAKLAPSGAPTQPVAGGTQPLPKATVKLQPAQPAAASGAVAPITTGKLSGELDDDSAEAGVTPFAAIALVVAIAALTIGLLTSQWVEQDKRSKEQTAWWEVPFSDYKHSSYEKVDKTTQIPIWSYSFSDNILPEIREYAAWKKQQL